MTTKKTSQQESYQQAEESSNSPQKSSAQSYADSSLEGAHAAFPVVGIGASAGGLEALEKLFNAMPPDSGITFVIIQHPGPNRERYLTDLLKKFTRMSVEQVKDRMPIQPNRVYVSPPDSNMELKNGILHLTKPTRPHNLRLPVNHFFHSLAVDQGNRAICLILSGRGSDGTLGMKAVKKEGGLVIAQDPETAFYEGMPLSAINTGLVDTVLAPENMARQLIDHIQSLFEAEANRIRSFKPGIREHLQEIFAVLKNQTGYNFSGYKENTLVRRIEWRMMVNKISRTEDYLQYLQQTPLEVETLFREMLIGVTSFFRDPEAFACLEQNVIVPLLQKKQEQTNLVRIWIPGCSTGEEAYSVAILLYEQMEQSGRPVEIQIFATDIDQTAINQARLGRYPGSIAADVKPEYLKRFFIRDEVGDTYQVQRHIRDMIVFAVQSVIKDPPFSKLDLICCRNLMIFLGLNLQQRLFAMFHYALDSGGYLFLGNSETLGNSQKLFQTLDRQWKIFKRAEFVADIKPVLKFSGQRKRLSRSQKKPVSARELTEQLILAEYKSTSVLINEKGEMLYIHGPTGKYLEQSTGKASTNILQIAREDLWLPLSTALRNANAKKKPQTIERILVENEGGVTHVKLTVTPVLEPADEQDLMLVTFIVLPAPLPSESNKEAEDANYSYIEHISKLEQELKATREYLRTIIEELENTNDELKSANEELHSANEELHSTNEELQTSKEEVQSANEELVTVNSELQARVDELIFANDDIKNLMESTQVGIIFLDAHLCIRRFTQSSKQMVDLIPEDIGRPLKQFVHKLRYERLMQDAQEVLESRTDKEVEVQAENDQWYLLRIIPYRTVEDRIVGVVLTLTNVSQIKLVAEALHVEQRKLKVALENMDIGVIVTDPLGKFLVVNREFLRIVGFDSYEEARIDHEQYVREWELLTLEREVVPIERWPAFRALQGDYARHYEVILHHKSSNREIYCEYNVAPVKNTFGEVSHLVFTIQDISERKRTEEALRQSEARERARAHDLETLLDAVPAIVWVAHDADCQKITGNRAATEFLRMPQEANQSKTAKLNESPRHFTVWKDGKEIPLQQLPVQLAGQGMIVTDFEEEVRFDDGARHWLIGNASPLYDEQGHVRGAIAAFRDITKHKWAEKALRESEERFRAIVYSTGDIIYTLDTEQRHTGVYGEWITQAGLTPEFFLGKTARDIFGEEAALLHEKHNAQALAGERVVYEWSVQMQGQIRHYQTVVSPLRGGKGALKGLVGVGRDITALKQAEAALRKSERSYRFLVESIPNTSIHLVDHDLRFLITGGSELAKNNLEKSQVEGLTLREAFPSDVADFFEPLYRRAFNGEAIEFGMPYGPYDYFQQIVPIRDKEGDIFAVMVISSNITERKQAEEALRKSENRLSLARNAGKIGIWDWDMEHNSLIWDERMYEMYGIEAQAFGGTYEAWQKGVHPDDLAEANVAVEQAIHDQREFHFEFRIVRPSGEVRHIEAHALVIYNADNQPSQMVGVNIDITERKQAEEALRQSEENLRITLDSIGDAVIVTDTRGQIINMNPVAERLSGWSLAEAVKKPFSQVFPLIQAQSRKSVASPVEAILQTGQMVRLTEDIILIAKSGRERYVSDSGAPIQNRQGEIVGMVLVLRDVTHQLKNEQELLKASKLESVGVLAGGIAHDFNNLLTTLFGNIEMAKLALTSTHEAYPYLDATGNAMERAKNLTKQLLTFAKGGAPVKEIQDIKPMLVEAANFAMHGSKSKVNIVIAPDLWPVEVDEGQLSQVIDNLIINAQQAMPEGGSITLNAINVKIAEQPYVEITVQDEGLGIAPENLNKIFDPYFSTKPDNSGLGLATVHSIITKHKGQITVDSRLHKGTVFTINLPANPEAISPTVFNLVEEAPTGQANSAHILVLDDEEAVRAVLKAMLTRSGYQVTLTTEGQDTIAAYQKALDQGSPYQAVILDLTIPGGMGGQDVARLILAIDPQAQLIASSGYATDSVMANYKNYGFKARVEKPYRLATLLQILHAVLS